MDRQANRQGPIVSLVLETTQVFFKVRYVLLVLLDHFSTKARCLICFRPT